MARKLLIAMAVLVLPFEWAGAQVVNSPPDGLPSRLMLATVRIANPKSTATGFVLDRTPTDGSEPACFVLITAHHVLEQAVGESTEVLFHRATEAGDYARVPCPVPIRAADKPLWVRHPKWDVAALPIQPPDGVSLPRLPLDLLASDQDLAPVQPGDLVRCFVYPHANIFKSGPAEFPVVRLGCVASFPLRPATRYPTLLIDYNTFEGDSGGPVLWCQPTDVSPGKDARIVGLVGGQHFINQRFEFVYESGEFRKQLGLAIVVPGQTIRETLSLLPPPAGEK